MSVQIRNYHDYYEPPEAIYTCDSCGCRIDEDDLPEGLDDEEVYCQSCWEEKLEEERDEFDEIDETQRESENGSNLHSNADIHNTCKKDEYKVVCDR